MNRTTENTQVRGVKATSGGLIRSTILSGAAALGVLAVVYLPAEYGMDPTGFGAVLGLIQAMANISEPQLLGLGIATAFVATIYGVGFANLVFIPVGNKLKSLVQQRTLYHELIIEGLVSIAHGENPRNIERKLAAYHPG